MPSPASPFTLTSTTSPGSQGTAAWGSEKGKKLRPAYLVHCYSHPANQGRPGLVRSESCVDFCYIAPKHPSPFKSCTHPTIPAHVRHGRSPSSLPSLSVPVSAWSLLEGSRLHALAHRRRDPGLVSVCPDPAAPLPVCVCQRQQVHGRLRAIYAEGPAKDCTSTSSNVSAVRAKTPALGVGEDWPGMMEVTNASGRKVSLLNDEPPAYSSVPRSRLNDHSRKSSCSTQTSRDDCDASRIRTVASPAHSPRSTPPLARLDSTSSQGTLQTPSPMTPMYPFDPLEQNKTSASRDPYYRSNGPYYVHQAPDGAQQPHYNHIPIRGELLMDDVYPSLGTPLQTQLAYATSELGTPISPQPTLQTPTTATSSASQPASSPANNNSKIAKKKYHCPHATKYACTDTFTTSGHAARHGKKHTGEKNILCPTCNKAFTRKDNMKQHERTHKITGAEQTAASPVLTSGSSRRPQSSRSQPTTTASTPDIVSDMEIEGPGSDFAGDATARASQPRPLPPGVAESLEYSQANSSLSIDTSLAQATRPPFDRTLSGGSQDGEGESPGLDALAMAASM
ncbi:Zinc finger and SCAN domain-containing protein 5B [Lambiella insularis]|nr:Zinc finger and SCAN domain-containing protein 5B [Lambiella insularis]